MQNQYRSERVPEDMPVLTLRDDTLRVDVVPQFGAGPGRHGAPPHSGETAWSCLDI